MRPTKSCVMRLPDEQQALLTALLPDLRHMAGHVHYRLLAGQELCEPADLLQEALADMFAARVHPPADLAQLKTWAYTTLKRRALNYMSQRKRDYEGSYNYVRERDYYDLVPDYGEEKVAYLYRVARLHLRPIVNQVLIGYGLGHSGLKIAADLGIPHNTVKTHFHTAKLRLRKLCITAN